MGVEASGLDLRSGVSQQVADHLKAACRDHLFLLVRDQGLDFDQQVAFGEVFGSVLETRAAKTDPLVVRYSSHTNGTSQRKTWSPDLPLHFDHWLLDGMPVPVRFTMLYAIVVTEDGGETVLVNAIAAYDRLPALLRNRIEGLTALHCYDYSMRDHISSRIRKRDLPPGQPESTHPLVLIHPDTGKRVLYVSPRNTDQILELEAAKSEDLLSQLSDHLINSQPTFTYLHKWRRGDVLLWDNHAILHGRRAFDLTCKRQLRRVSII